MMNILSGMKMMIPCEKCLVRSTCKNSLTINDSLVFTKLVQCPEMREYLFERVSDAAMISGALDYGAIHNICRFFKLKKWRRYTDSIDTII